tara:strand:+ start:25 stop:564 length:540 start_codon:yes stop_codon:yes gene_type:complete
MYTYPIVRQHIQKAMNWTEYREQLTKNVDGLSSRQKLKFAIEVCEKLFPDYKTFQDESKWGNTNLIADGLAACNQSANGLDTDEKSVQILIAGIEKITPDTEDFGEVSGSLALNSAAAVCEALSFILDNKTKRISDIGGLSYDSAYFKACEDYPKLSESEIKNHQNLQNEIKWQLEKTN